MKSTDFYFECSFADCCCGINMETSREHEYYDFYTVWSEILVIYTSNPISRNSCQQSEIENYLNSP